MEIQEYVTVDGRNPFGDWFEDLDPYASAKVAIAVTRLSRGNFSNVEGVGAGVFEYKLNVGPGYRIYFGKDGETLILLLGGTKRRQQIDIQSSISRWQDYKTRTKGGR